MSLSANNNNLLSIGMFSSMIIDQAVGGITIRESCGSFVDSGLVVFFAFAFAVFLIL
jgi:hypothetical protein